MAKKYTVKVDDNYHSMGSSEPYKDGSYNSLEKAIEKCRKITIESLGSFYEEGISPEKLSAQWAMFGDDPFIVGGDGPVPFSARKFINTELCVEVIEARVKHGERGWFLRFWSKWKT